MSGRSSLWCQVNHSLKFDHGQTLLVFGSYLAEKMRNEIQGKGDNVSRGKRYSK